MSPARIFEPISWTASDPGLDPVLISQASELQLLLTGSLPGNPNGNIFTTHGGTGGFGADGGFVQSISYNGVTYLQSTYGNQVAITDIHGGKLIFNFKDNGLNDAGDWNYYAPGNLGGPVPALDFDYVLVDGDGDTTPGELLINLQPAPAIAVSDVSVAEDGGHAVFNVTLSHATLIGVPLTFAVGGGTATAGVDYGTTIQWFNGSTWVSTPFTFAPGDTSVQVRVAIINDTLFENPNETFVLTATAGTGTSNGNDLGTGTILNDGDVNAPPTVVANTISGIVEGAHTNNGSGVGTGPTAGTTTVAAINVLTNDVDPGDTLKVTQITPQGGSASAVPNGGSIIVQGLYGTLTIYSSGSTTYNLDNTLATTQALAERSGRAGYLQLYRGGYRRYDRKREHHGQHHGRQRRAGDLGAVNRAVRRGSG